MVAQIAAAMMVGLEKEIVATMIRTQTCGANLKQSSAAKKTTSVNVGPCLMQMGAELTVMAKFLTLAREWENAVPQGLWLVGLLTKLSTEVGLIMVV